MSLKEQINEDMKTYMREKNTISLNAVRMLKAEIKNAEIEAIREFNDDEIIKVVLSSIKKRKDAAEIFEKSSRKDLADKELEEVKTLEKYLPAQMSEEEITKCVKDTFAELEEAQKRNFGAVMKAVMAKVSGKAEGRVVSNIIKGVIDGNS